MSKKDYCNIPVIFKRTSTKNAYEMRQWLVDNIDPECYDAEDFNPVHLDPTCRRIWFSRDQDAVLFILRWS
jgi:hypothetical protein